MNQESEFIINTYDFNANIYDKLQNQHYVKDLWPLVYILSDDQINEAYVGETANTYGRIAAHLTNKSKKKLTTVHLITSGKFNKSATLDIESNLIKYFSGDGKYKLLNGNAGLANHNYYQKREVYWDLFKTIWNNLRGKGISVQSIEDIDNSDLFKYSPYKSLTTEQRSGLIAILKCLTNKEIKTVIVEGGAGTGKTILATFLFKLLNTSGEDFNFDEFEEDEFELRQLIIEVKKIYSNPKMGLVVPMSSFRKTLEKVFKNIKGLRANMVIGPAEVTRNRFDILVVDESHRLRRRVNLGTYFDAFGKASTRLGLDKSISTELDWILIQSSKSILFYDKNQSIKPSDVKKEDFDKLKNDKSTRIEYLKSQFRVKGGNDYVKYIDDLLNCKLESTSKIFDTSEYEFVLFDSIDEMRNQIILRNAENGLARLVAGFSWKWISKKNPNLYDIKIDNIELKWNTGNIDWVYSENAINEVGCIHTTQGYDLNYGGIIFGEEISYDKVNDEIIIKPENYYDRNGYQGITDPEALKGYIINIYKTIMLRGIKGTYVYVCDKNLREYFSKHIANYNKEQTTPIIPIIDVKPYENSVPLYNLRVAAGDFSESQIVDVTDYEWVKIPSRYKLTTDLFACRVEGESMNRIIPNGSICLFRKYSGGTRDGRIVIVELTGRQDPDSGSFYTVKEYHSKKIVEDDQWHHESITLKPFSSNPGYQYIVLKEDEVDNLQVIGIFECVLY